MDALLEELCKRKGAEEGSRIYRTILPGIVSDFNGMLKKVKVGVTVTEEYKIDDGSGTVLVEGERLANGEVNLRSCLL